MGLMLSSVNIFTQFSPPIGLFSYIHIELPYYTFGIQRVKLTDEQFAMIASSDL